MKAYGRKITGILLIIVLSVMCVVSATVHAAQILIPDLERTGSIVVTMKDPETEKAVGGGSMTLYRVADVKKENSADYSFALTEEFSAGGQALTTLDASHAQRLAAYALERKLAGRNGRMLRERSGTTV